jgi:hypothetical protein
VENFYVDHGYLLPNFHKYYWLGAQVNGPWPNFTWVSLAAKPCCCTVTSSYSCGI